MSKKINLENSELGGIYVLLDFRGEGSASKIVSRLVSISDEYKYVYCIQFEHLERFYKSFGFESINDVENVPGKIDNKHRWCNEYYEEKNSIHYLNCLASFKWYFRLIIRKVDYK